MFKRQSTYNIVWTLLSGFLCKTLIYHQLFCPTIHKMLLVFWTLRIKYVGSRIHERRSITFTRLKCPYHSMYTKPEQSDWHTDIKAKLYVLNMSSKELNIIKIIPAFTHARLRIHLFVPTNLHLSMQNKN